MNQELLQKLTAVHQRLEAGDRRVMVAVAAVKRRAKAGDQRSALYYNTLAAIHFRRGTTGWRDAEVFYKRLQANDRNAWAFLRKTKTLADQGSENAKKAFSLLKAVHHHYKKSVWYPGAPKTGYYPMPNLHRAGISIPGLGEVPIPGMPGGASPGWPPGLPGIPGLTPTPGTLNIPGLGEMPIPPGVVVPPGMPGYTPPQPGLLGQYLPLTQQIVTNLLGLIASARQSQPMIFNASNPNRARPGSYTPQYDAYGNEIPTGHDAAGNPLYGPQPQAQQAYGDPSLAHDLGSFQSKAASQMFQGGTPTSTPRPSGINTAAAKGGAVNAMKVSNFTSFTAANAPVRKLGNVRNL